MCYSEPGLLAVTWFGSPQQINLLFQDTKESTVSALSVVTAEVSDKIAVCEVYELY